MSEQEQIEQIWKAVSVIAEKIDRLPIPDGLLSCDNLRNILSVGGKRKSARWLERELATQEWQRILKPVKVGLTIGFRRRDVDKLLEHLER